MIEAPPPGIVNALALWIPGIWPVFLRAANASLAPGDVVTSWWRSPDRNAQVGGHVESQHLVGLAFDAASPDPPGLASRLRAVGFTTVEAAGHVHAQAFQAGILGRAGVFEVLGLRRL